MSAGVFERVSRRTGVAFPPATPRRVWRLPSQTRDGFLARGSGSDDPTRTNSGSNEKGWVRGCLNACVTPSAWPPPRGSARRGASGTRASTPRASTVLGGASTARGKHGAGKHGAGQARCWASRAQASRARGGLDLLAEGRVAHGVEDCHRPLGHLATAGGVSSLHAALFHE